MDNLLPWYQRTLRWGQTNITELDPIRYDIDWWRGYWQHTHVQGVIINAGGIVAYYPSANPLHQRAQFLGERDLYGELVQAARQENLTVLARMDSNRAGEPFYQAHPDWFTVDQAGSPYRAGERYIACVNSPYYADYIPEILSEIIARSHPDGFTDNSWSGLERGRICYCLHCARAFRAFAGMDLPQDKDWDSPVYRAWIRWNYARRLEIWQQNNRTTQSCGGSDCLWLGMNSGDMLNQSGHFRDTRAILQCSEIVMLDHQHRSNERGFQDNSHTGKLLHGLLGWDKLIPESMPLYQGSAPVFRLSSKPAAEARLWMAAGFAGTIQPWWHHISAYHEDRRQYATAEPLMCWHTAHQEYLVNRTPVASVGVVWSQENIDFYGRDAAAVRVMQPYWGVLQALIRARIPYLPVHASDIDLEAGSLQALVLPNTGALSQNQVDSIRRFVGQGKGLVATGQASLFNEWGDRRDDFALADVLGVHAERDTLGTFGNSAPDWESYAGHSYLRLHPELRANVYGPSDGKEPAINLQRHAALAGFDQTDILPFGGQLQLVRLEPGVEAPLTYIPPFPIYPPETAWMRQPDSGFAALALRTSESGSRIAYLPADIDRCFARYNLPDHGDLLANIITWAAGGRHPLRVTGTGLIDCHLYRQPGRVVLHIVNLTSAGAWRAPVHELIPVGPFTVEIDLPESVGGKAIQCLVSGESPRLERRDRSVCFELPRVTDHEVVVIEF